MSFPQDNAPILFVKDQCDAIDKIAPIFNCFGWNGSGISANAFTWYAPNRRKGQRPLDYATWSGYRPTGVTLCIDNVRYFITGPRDLLDALNDVARYRRIGRCDETALNQLRAALSLQEAAISIDFL